MSASGEAPRRLDDVTLVATRQLYEADLPSLAAAGIRLIVNNRPDGEEPGQPSSAEIEAAARAAGLDYRHIPIAGGFPPDRIEAMAQALEQGPLLAYCRSGTRSTFLWALARAKLGAAAGDTVAAAAAAGYDLAPIRGWL
ncbi:MAG TPA: TIGR01244 family sulfur transferase [Allosphingosinicella sp.]|nr:TIGR01244 family sulfur transferase [Allosphingosinicella sp.]